MAIQRPFSVHVYAQTFLIFLCTGGIHQKHIRGTDVYKQNGHYYTIPTVCEPTIREKKQADIHSK